MTIGNKLMIERRRRGLRQEDLAKEIGVSTRTINLYENGKSYPGEVNAKKLSQFFGVSDDFFWKKAQWGIDSLVKIPENTESTTIPPKTASTPTDITSIIAQMQQAVFAGGNYPEEELDLFYQAATKAYLEAKKFYKNK